MAINLRLSVDDMKGLQKIAVDPDPFGTIVIRKSVCQVECFRLVLK